MANESREFLNTILNHPEFWFRLTVIVAVGVVVIRGLALVHRRVLGEPFSPWLEAFRFVGFTLLVGACLPDWSLVAAMMVLLLGAMISTTFDAWRKFLSRRSASEPPAGTDQLP